MIYRHSVPVDVADFEVPAGRVVHVAADREGKHDRVDVWVEHQAGVTHSEGGIVLNVHGTGHPIPADGRAHVGSCIVGWFVWHVYASQGGGDRA
ncbi:DUF7352 domain-containing protein [Leucobacter sp. HY1908]